MLQRPLALRVGQLRIHLELQQTADQGRRRRGGKAGQGQRATAFGVHQHRIGAGFNQRFQGRQAATAGSLQQRRALLPVLDFQIGTRAHQLGDDLRVPGECGTVQCRGTAAVGAVGRGLVAQQQLHAGRVVVFTTGGGHQRRGGLFNLRARTALQQEPGQAPVAGHAGHAQRGQAVMVERIHIGRGVTQQRHHAGVGAAPRVMHGGISFAIGRGRIGTVGEQGHDRVRTAVPAVAGGGQQRSQAPVRGIYIHPAGNQFTQQTQVGQHRRQHRQGALVAIVRGRQRVRIRALGQQFKRPLHAPPAGSRVQRRLQITFLRLQLHRRRFAGHFDHLHRQSVGRRQPLQQHMHQRPDQQAQSRQDPARAAFHQARPDQQQLQHQRHGDHAGQPRAARCGSIAISQHAPRRRDAVAIALHRVPHRPRPPQRQHADAGHRAQRQHRAQRFALQQDGQRPRRQQGGHRAGDAPQQQQVAQIPGQQRPCRCRPGAAPPTHRQGEGRLRQPSGEHGSQASQPGQQHQQRTHHESGDSRPAP